MQRWSLLILVTLLTALPTAVWSVDEPTGVKPETASLYRNAREQVEKLSVTPAAKYTPEIIKQARESIVQAQHGLEIGNDRVTRESAERATLQAKLALAASDERIAAEKAAAAKQELATLEQRLNAILAGKGEQP